MIQPRLLLNGNPATLLLSYALPLIICLGLASCAAPKGAETRYDLKGKVVSVDRAKGQVVINHEAIPGYMEAMEMPFPLPDREALQSIEAGNQIQATLVVTNKGYRIENPIITKSAIADPSAEISSREPKIGAEAPDAALVNQDGKRVALKQYRGRALLITFIYTRCPLADYCPLMSSNFAALNRELEKDTSLASRAHLLSVTLDPEFDQPEVLRSYGAAHTEKYKDEKFERWTFATGHPAEIRRLAEFLGVTYVREDGQITHSLRTVLIAPDGKIFKVYRGNEWKPEAALADIRLALNQKPSA